MKRCTKCGEEKPFAEFRKNAAKKDGLFSQCKQCKSAHDKAYVAANREKVAARNKAYREANRKQITLRMKLYSEANRGRVKAYEETDDDTNQ